MSARDDSGSGTVLGLALLGAIVGLATLALPLYRACVVAQSVAGAADASALAAADVSVGIAPGVPCTVAAEVATANSTKLMTCGVDGSVATVEMAEQFLGVQIAASATAGPMNSVSN